MLDVPGHAVRPSRRSVRITCQIVRERDFVLVARQTLDLSRSGMLVIPDVPVLTGEPLVVTFRIPLGGATWFDAEAVVTRVLHGRRRGERRRSLALAFTHVDTVAAIELERRLEWFSEASARPRA